MTALCCFFLLACCFISLNKINTTAAIECHMHQPRYTSHSRPAADWSPVTYFSRGSSFPSAVYVLKYSHFGLQVAHSMTHCTVSRPCLMVHWPVGWRRWLLNWDSQTGSYTSLIGSNSRRLKAKSGWAATQRTCDYYAPPLIGGALSDAFV